MNKVNVKRRNTFATKRVNPRCVLRNGDVVIECIQKYKYLGSVETDKRMREINPMAHRKSVFQKSDNILRKKTTVALLRNIVDRQDTLSDRDVVLITNA